MSLFWKGDSGNMTTGSRATTHSKTPFRRWLPLLALLVALPLSRAFASFGAMGLYLPLTLSVVICAWYGGVGPALVCQLSGAFIAISFLVRSGPTANVTADQVYGLLGFLVVGKLSLFLTAYIRWYRDLRVSEESFRLVATATNDAICEWDLLTDRILLRGNLNGIFGYPDATPVEKSSGWFHERIHSDDAETVWQQLQETLTGSSVVWSTEYRLRKADGTYVLVAGRGTVVRDRSGRAVRMIGGLSDITAVRQAQERLAFDALHDELTGLPNRQYFRDRLREAISGQEIDSLAAAVLFLDLDRFKTVNDSLGHAVGDKLLRAISKRIELALRPGEMASRFGADEFTILISEVGSPADAIGAAERIQQSLAVPFEVEQHTLVITASIGMAISKKGSSPEQILRHADVAMHRAKTQGRARFEIFESDRDARRMNLVQLESEIRKGMLNGDFRLWYQPIVNLKSGELSGMEALLRWQHPQRGLLLPAEFLPVAEESGLIVSLGNWVLQTACEHVRRCGEDQASPQGLFISVNIAERQFVDPGLPTAVQACLEANGLAGSGLVLELTENIVLDGSGEAAAQMRRFRQMGVRFAIDDFGRERSSLARVHELPISILKIDGSFVRAISIGRPMLVNAIVALGGQLGMDVVAECVETRGEAEHLRNVHCTAGQGSYFSGPLEAAAMRELIRTHRHWPFDRGFASGTS